MRAIPVELDMSDALDLKRRLEAIVGVSGDMLVVYDGECVFCNAYIRLMQLRQAVGRVVLIDARANAVAQTVMETVGLDLDEGMLVLYGGRTYYGGDALNILSLLADGTRTINNTMAAIFKRPKLSLALYPILKLGRRIALVLRGRGRIPTAKVLATETTDSRSQASLS